MWYNPGMMPTPDQGVDNSAFDKASRDALASVALMYRECHAEAPDSDICGALQDIQKALSEVHSRKMSGQAASAPTTIDGAVEQLHGETMNAAQPPQEGGY